MANVEIESFVVKFKHLCSVLKKAKEPSQFYSEHSQAVAEVPFNRLEAGDGCDEHSYHNNRALELGAPSRCQQINPRQSAAVPQTA